MNITDTSMGEYRIAIIGLGYVGLPLLKFFSEKYQTIGFDINSNRIRELRNGLDVTNELEFEDLANLKFTDELEQIKDSNVYIITVPTPINEDKSPDLSALESASILIGGIIKSDDLIIYESTVYPGCTEEVCIPILQKESNLKLNKDFHVGYSPERVVPGDRTKTIDKIQKIVSASSNEALDKIDMLYSNIIIAGTYRAKSIVVAEAAKAIENAQRDLNISFVNELAIIFSKIGIDTNDVLEAAATKWNFHRYTPGLVGGHCIGVDPYYLVYKSKKLGYTPKVILSGRNLNESISSHIVDTILIAYESKNNKKADKSCKALILGITFKENCPDIRNTGVFNIIKTLEKKQISYDVYDPVASKEEVAEEYKIELSTPIKRQYEFIILAVGHRDFYKFNPDDFLKENGVVFDVKSFYPQENNYLRL